MLSSILITKQFTLYVFIKKNTVKQYKIRKIKQKWTKQQQHQQNQIRTKNKQTNQNKNPT